MPVARRSHESSSTPFDLGIHRHGTHQYGQLTPKEPERETAR